MTVTSKGPPAIPGSQGGLWLYLGMLVEGMIYGPRRTGQGGSGFHHAAQNGAQFKTDELFISGIFHLIFLNHY